jgi:exodeoxyribonuclease V alpha subunit
VKDIVSRRNTRGAVDWAEQKAVREIIVFPHSHGVGTARAVRIFKNYEDAFARFLPPEPNIRTLKRGGGEKT